MTEQVGLIMSNYLETQFLPSTQNKSFSLFKYFWGSDKQNAKKNPKDLRLFQIHNRYFIMASNNEMSLIFVQSGKQMTIEQSKRFTFDERINYFSTNWTMPFQNVLVVIGFESELILFTLDFGNKQLIKRSSLKIKDITSITFVNGSTLWVVSKHCHLTQIQCATLKLVISNQLSFDIQKPAPIYHGILVTPDIKGKQYHLYYFFFTRAKQNGLIIQTIYVKELIKMPNGVVVEGSLFKIKQLQCMKPVFIEVDIEHNDDIFWLTMEDEIVLIKKKLNSYYFMDTIRKKNPDTILKLLKGGTLCVIAQNSAQLSSLAVKQPKCIVEVFDMFTFPTMDEQQQQYEFYQVLLLQDQYMFLFRSKINPFKMRVSFTEVQNAMNKIIKYHHQGVLTNVIDHVAKVLKIPKKDFYLRLWYQSEKQLTDVRTKLMLCDDIAVIKDEIKLALRRKTSTIYQIIEIYTLFYELIRMQLSQHLNLRLIKMAAQFHFLLRKLKRHPDKSTILGLKEFSQIKNKGIIRYIQQTIINDRRISNMCTRDRDKIRKQNPNAVKVENLVKDIFIQFRYIFLENYDDNLIDLIKPFGKDLVYIFEKFPFLIPNNTYSFEFQSKQLARSNSSMQLSKTPSNDSNNIFSPMGEYQWQSELSISQIRRYLLNHHPTSAVEAMLASFIADEQFRKLKLQRHGVIYTTMQEYANNVRLSVTGIRLYLRIIEFSNTINCRQQEDLNEIIEDLTQVFKKKKNLSGDNLLKVRLYGKIHALFLVNAFDPLPDMNTLIGLNTEQLISLFFLGNRHKINLIFNELKQIYDSVTGNQNLFNNIIRQFVQSSSCSPVQLRLLMFSVDKKGKTFQDNNQALILALINGFCERMQVGQRQKIQQFTGSLNNISLSLQLNERIMNIIKIKALDQLFIQFKCQHLSLHSVEFEGFKTLSLILQNYFVYQMYSTQLNIQGQVLNLEIPRNMLNVMIYLQQQLYQQSVSLEQIVLLFGEKLVEYEAFDDIRQFINDQTTLRTMQISPVGYAEAVIRQAFIKLYKQPGNYVQMKHYIHQILKLQVQTTEYLQQQVSRVQLCELISNCNFQIHPAQVGYGPHKVEFMFDFIQRAYESLSIEKVTQIYYCFRGMQGYQDVQIDSELLTYIGLFTKACIKNEKLQAGIQGVCYLLKMDCLKEIKSLTAQTFLQFVYSRFPNQSVEALQIIQYFCMNQQDKDALINLFTSDLNMIQTYQNQEQFLEVNEKLHYLKLKTIDVMLKDLRDIAKKIGIVPKYIYRYYYFSLSILSQPSDISIIHIIYDLNSLDDLIDLLCKKLSVKINFVGINFNEFLFRRFFLNALCQLGCHLTSEEQFNIESMNNFEDQLPLLNMIEKLKESNQSQVLKIVRKNIRYIQDNKLLNENKQKKVKKYQKAIIDQINAITIDTNLVPRAQIEAQSRSMLEQKKKQNMTLRQFLSVTMNASMNNPTMNEKQIIEMIKEDNNSKILEQFERKSPARGRGMTIRHTNYQQFQFYLQQQYFELFDNKKYYEIDCKDRIEMMKYLKEYYQTDRQIGNFIKLLQGLKLGEQRNIKIVQSAMRVNTPNIDLKKLFKFDFYFFTPDSFISSQQKTSSNEFYARVFEYLVPSINQIIRYDTWMMLSKIVCVSLKFEKEYEYKVIMFALESFLADSQFVTNQFVQTLNQFLQKLSVSSIFLAKHFKQPLRSCQSLQVQRHYLQMIHYCLSNPDQNNGRMQQSQRQFIEQTILSIQEHLQSQVEQQ